MFGGAILSKAEFVMGEVGWGNVVFWPNILSILVLIVIRIRIKTRLWQYLLINFFQRRGPITYLINADCCLSEEWVPGPYTS